MTSRSRVEADALGDEILRSLRRILRRVTLHSRQIHRETKLTLPQVLTLRALGEMQGGRASQVELSRALGLSQPTVTGIIDRLERAGLAKRERSTLDRRKIDVSLSDTGRARLKSLPTPMQEQFIARMMELSMEERATLLQSLNRVVTLMEAESIDAAPLLLPDAEIKPSSADE
jgi:DNA-binding MarR family transcriptional regulator